MFNLFMSIIKPECAYEYVIVISIAFSDQATSDIKVKTEVAMILTQLVDLVVDCKCDCFQEKNIFKVINCKPSYIAKAPSVAQIFKNRRWR